MKRSLKTLSILIVLLASIATGYAQNELKLEYKLNAGDKYEQKINMTMPMTMNAMGETIEMNMDMELRSLIECLAVDKGNAKIRFTHQQMKTKVEMPAMGVNVELDSESDGTSKELEALRRFLNKPIEFEMAPNGEVIKITDDKAFREAIKASSKEGDALSEEKIDLIIKNMVGQSLGGVKFPTKAIAIGESWTSEYFTTAILGGDLANSTQNLATLTQTLDSVGDKSFETTGSSPIEVETNGIKLKGNAIMKCSYNKASGVLEWCKSQIEMDGDYLINDFAMQVKSTGEVVVGIAKLF